MPWRRKATLSIALGIIVVIILLAYWVFGIRSQSTRPVRLAINSLAVASAPVFATADAGFARNAGVSVQELSFAAGRLALDALLGGQADVATAAETPFLLASANRPDLRLIMTISESEYRIVARRRSNITTRAQLRGKTLGTLMGTAAEFFLDAMLADVEVQRSEVRVVNLQPGDMVAAIRRGDVDAVSVWEPHAQRVIDALGTDAVVFEDNQLYMEHFNLVTTESVIADKRSALEKLLLAIVTSSDWIRSRPNEAIDLTAGRIGMERTDLKAIWHRFAFPASLSGRLVPALERVETWAAQNQGRAARDRTTLLGLVDPSLLRSQAPSHVDSTYANVVK